eukprot:11996375-Alexandrium_andersonii.AAC.1
MAALSKVGPGEESVLARTGRDAAGPTQGRDASDQNVDPGVQLPLAATKGNTDTPRRSSTRQEHSGNPGSQGTQGANNNRRSSGT